jgi:magnesium-transporting ATPase (P-type)
VYTFNATFGSMLWLYVSEILGPKGLSLVAFINLVFTVIFGCCGNIFFKLLTAAGVYLSLFFIQIVCIFFIYQYVVETRGRTKEECEKLYLPNEVNELKTKIELTEL